MKDEQTIINSLREKSARLFNHNDGQLIVRSPGRINLIGEHTDYNEGFVLPSAIDRAIYFAINARNDSEARLYTLDFDDDFRFDVRNPVKSNKSWANYLIGIVSELNKSGRHIGGFDCVFSGNIPIGAGMSSSAALEAGLAYALDMMFNLGLERGELAELARQAENDFVGVKCGIMDQFANLFSKGKSVLYLDCRNMEYDYLPFVRKDIKVILCDTGVKHSLASSEYNLRRQQCETGVQIMRRYDPQVKSLRDVDFEMLDEHAAELGDVVYKRCRYVLEENIRVNSAKHYLQQSDYASFGELLYLSHEGAREKYEVSCAELDLLVDTASGINGVLGARMMGGGFGGCTLNLVEDSSVEEFEGSIGEVYRKCLDRTVRIYECSLMPGTEVIANSGHFRQD
ncbi:MAG TPA: galactokinase [Candidatus Acidoferrales bacterium]|nr:galactokinase [Candidatus Acidoferrales bacterium]